MTTVTEQTLDLTSTWQALRAEQPRLRIRNAARELGVSELELLLTGVDHEVTPLRCEAGDLLIAMQQAGRVMALSRNDQVVHERHGVYTDFKVAGKGAMGLCLGEIDLRTFLNHWRHAVAVQDRVPDGGDETKARQSIQFFDSEGEAIHKIFATADTDMDAWKGLIDRFRAAQSIDFAHEPKVAPQYPNAGQVSRDEVREPWSRITDVHHFNAMLKKLGIDRLEALELAGPDYARRVPVEAAEMALVRAGDTQQPIMVFVGNGGIVQIHTGTVSKLVRTGPWFNVLDPDFNLHLNTEELDSCWIVRRPTSDGVVTSLECFNADRQLVLTLFGERKPGQEELSSWRELTAFLETL